MSKTIEKWLEKDHSDLLRFVTAGSVDDGKSTLIGRLLFDSKCIFEDHLLSVEQASQRRGRKETDLSMLLDGLSAEREQGITIDVAYRYFSTPRRKFIIADTPGHEQYTRNMATGASTADLAVLLVDAEKGLTTQTRRHMFIASLLGITHIVIAVNKMDLIGYSQDVFEKIQQDCVEFAAKLEMGDLTFFPVSALQGDNVAHRSDKMPWYDGSPLLSFLETVQIAADRNLIDLRFPVQYVLRPSSNFRGYAGQVASGVIRKGDEVTVLPTGRSSRVKSVVTYDGEKDYAFAPQSVTVTLEDEVDVSRGDMLVHPHNLPTASRSLEATLVWMDEKPMRRDCSYLLKHSCRTSRATVDRLLFKIDVSTLHRQQAETLDLNDIGRVRISSQRGLMFDPYTHNRGNGSFILIDPDTSATVAAGIILLRRDEAKYPKADGSPVSRNITREERAVNRSLREKRQGHPAATVWLTGFSGSGKSTIARALEERLFHEGKNAYVLDGDNIRFGLNRDLGFSPEDRKENIRRISEVASLMNDSGQIIITAFISPYREDRDYARKIIGSDSFIEVFVDTPLDVCRQRDPKGLYKKAESGEIESFTGVSAPYEEPENPELVIRTEANSVDDAVDVICRKLSEIKKPGTNE